MAAALKTATAQNLSLGKTAAFNHTWLTNTGGDKYFNPGFNAGAQLVYSFNPNWGIGADVTFSMEGVRSKTTMGDGQHIYDATLNYIRVPLKGIYFFGKLGDRLRPKVFAGPSVGFLVGGSTKNFTENNSGDRFLVDKVKSKEVYRNVDLGVLVGAGLNYRIMKATWLTADVNYTNGLVDLSRSAGTWSASRGLAVSMGVTFPIGTIAAK